jgi:hypothetical protein
MNKYSSAFAMARRIENAGVGHAASLPFEKAALHKIKLLSRRGLVRLVIVVGVLPDNPSGGIELLLELLLRGNIHARIRSL